ncbi:MAG: LPS assembly lipoprotein LptE [Thermodesulfobacteriota bacterium]
MNRIRGPEPSAGRPFRGLAAALALALSLTGCGYYVSGMGGKLPEGVTTISIPMFENGTSKPDIEGILTTAFVKEFNTTVQVVNDAEVEVKGRIKVYSLVPVSFTESDINQEYRLTVVLSLAVFRGGEVLWRDDGVTDYEDFVVNEADVAATRKAEEKALKKLARDTARLVKERIMEDF